MHVEEIYRYPVKGLSPDPLQSVDVLPGETLPADRKYAVENGPSGFEPDAPSWFPKIKFLCWMKNPKLARLQASFDEAAGTVTIMGGDGTITADLDGEAGRAAIEAYLADYMAEEQRGPLKVLSTPGHSFSDVPNRVVSFINLESAADLGRILGTAVDPIRFRGNVHLSGLQAWEEATWVGRRFQVGDRAVFMVRKTIQRCLATHVDPALGVRDLDIMGTIRANRGDMDCGIYAEVVTAGTMRPGDRVRLLD
jgi:uncharacterized protein YcbX